MATQLSKSGEQERCTGRSHITTHQGKEKDQNITHFYRSIDNRVYSDGICTHLKTITSTPEEAYFSYTGSIFKALAKDWPRFTNKY